MIVAAKKCRGEVDKIGVIPIRHNADVRQKYLELLPIDQNSNSQAAHTIEPRPPNPTSQTCANSSSPNRHRHLIHPTGPPNPLRPPGPHPPPPNHPPQNKTPLYLPQPPPAKKKKMSLVHLSNVCSHMQNASKARLGLTSIPSTSLLLSLSLSLQKSGFLSSVSLGGLTPPPLDDLSSYVPEPVTTQNVSTRRLWLGLKYWNNEPVLSRMKMVSKPTKRLWMGAEDIGMICRGRERGGVKGLTGVGECLFVSTDLGILESRECAERKVGGMLLCRVA